jgi:hypothetical protein
VAKRHGEVKPWVHLEAGHLFDQTNGAMDFDVEDAHDAGMTDAERIANAGAIGGIAQSMGNGF